MNIFQKFEQLDTLVFDVDGVFTDGRILVTETGDMLRTVSTRDGLAVKMAIESGLNIIIITGGNSMGIKKRFEALGVRDIVLGAEDKWVILKKIINDSSLSLNNIGYMGDDIPDISPLKEVGLATCPQDAIPSVQEICDYISPIKGGYGCVRDLIEKIMRAQGKWPV